LSSSRVYSLQKTPSSNFKLTWRRKTSNSTSPV
jgi:hypothetical protein